MKNRYQNLMFFAATLALIGVIMAAPKLTGRLGRPAGDSLGPPPAPLPVVGSYQNLRKLMRRAQGQQRYGLGMEDSASRKMLGAAPRTPEYSRTNVQVQGVDEADIVKTDGEYIYQINDQAITISRVRPPTDMKVVASIKADTATPVFQPQELYVDDRYLVVVGMSMRPLPALDKQPPPSDQPENNTDRINEMLDSLKLASSATKVIVYDIGDKAAPKKIREAAVAGDYISSRKIGPAFYLVANKYIDSYMLDKYPDEPGLFRPAYMDSAASDKFRDIGYRAIRYFPNTVEPNYLMVAGMNLDKPEQEMQVSTYLGAGQNIYASTENLYAAVTKVSETTAGSEPSTPPAPPVINTQIYKFAFNNGETSYRGQGGVPGTILNQYLMDEFNGYFRLATTKGDPWGPVEAGSKNNIYVLDRDLKVAGKLEDLAPGERIYSARFMGDRAYLVTFKQVDPLFVIDLKDPAGPRVLGELKIPGYSDYLHPYDENHIIGFGKEAVEARGTALYQGMKVALFDVSDVARPVEKFKTTIGDRGTDSELLHNPKALLFDKDKDLLVFPVTVMENNDPNADPFSYGTQSFQGAYVYDISLDKGLNLKGRIGHQNIDRALYIGDTLYTVSKARIQANAIDDLKETGRVDLAK